MDAYEAFVVGAAIDQQPPPPPRPYRVEQRTADYFLNEMPDFEFKRTFRFSKEAVTYLKELLGNNYKNNLILIHDTSRD